MKISILILTHNRPHLFNRCINSVFKQQFPSDTSIEILVNNDTKDIEEIYHEKIIVKYFYETTEELSEIYRRLYMRSSGDYVYFLEDDDYLNGKFSTSMSYTHDVYFHNYYSSPLAHEHGMIGAINRVKQPIEILNVKTVDEFRKIFKPRYFQLGQLCFRREIGRNFFSIENRPTQLSYDLQLFKTFTNSTTIKYISTPTWVQTTDGGDNISFDILNTNPAFPQK